MNDERALLAAICAHPEEDTPRLMYADWLDDFAGSLPVKMRESARARAELIRVQCELARLPPDEEDADTATRRVELELRAEELLTDAERRKEWAAPVNPPPATHRDLVPDGEVFVRGFPVFTPYVQEAATHLDVGAALFDISPLHILWCGYLRNPVADRFLAQPWLSRIRRIAVTTWPESTDKLFAAPALAHLEELSVNIGEFVAPGAPIAGRALANVRRLRVRGHAYDFPATFARLGELLAPQARLREFELEDTRYTAADLATLAAFPQTSSLERLTLGTRSRFGIGNAAPLGVEGVRALTSAQFWPHLRCLRDEVGGAGLGSEEIHALIEAPPAPNLRTLTLGTGNLRMGFVPLLGSPLLAPVTSLDLSNAGYGDFLASYFRHSPHLGRLLNLKLNNCEIATKGVRDLAEAPFAPNLVRLELQRNALRKQAVDVLVSSSTFPKLRLLDLQWSVSNSAQQERLRARFGNGVRF